MKDFLGNEIHIGDTIVFTDNRKTSHGLAKGVVTGFTSDMVKIEWDYYWRENTKRLPEKVVVIK